jgi:hypothetical protein
MVVAAQCRNGKPEAMLAVLPLELQTPTFFRHRTTEPTKLKLNTRKTKCQTPIVPRMS